MKKFIIIAAASMLGACANSGVVQMSQNSYLISKDSAKVGGGISQAVRIEVYQEANAFCAKSGRFVETQDLLMQPGMPGRLGNVTLQFRCTITGDSNGVPLQQGPDQVIEVRRR